MARSFGSPSILVIVLDPSAWSSRESMPLFVESSGPLGESVIPFNARFSFLLAEHQKNLAVLFGTSSTRLLLQKIALRLRERRCP
jgi:hypothetical protein